MKNRQNDKKTKQVRIDSELHKLLKIRAAEEKMTMKDLLEEYLAEKLIGKRTLYRVSPKPSLGK